MKDNGPVHSQYQKEESYQSKTLFLLKLSLKSEDETKTLKDKQKLKEF